MKWKITTPRAATPRNPSSTTKCGFILFNTAVSLLRRKWLPWVRIPSLLKRTTSNIQHALNHSTYHRGQVAILLRQLGHTPPFSDYHDFLTEARTSPS